MAGPVYVSTYEEPPFRTEEILRYAGASGADQEDILRLERECTDTVKGKLSYRVCWLEVPVLFDGKDIDLGFVRTDSVSLRRHLSGCLPDTGTCPLKSCGISSACWTVPEKSG